MTQTQQLIEQVRKKLGGATDYKIAQALDLHSEYVSRYVSGDKADAYACAKIAEILERDPLEVIAQVEAEAARTEKKRDYWKRMSFGLRRTALGVALSATCVGSVVGPRTGEAAISPDSHNVYYVNYTKSGTPVIPSSLCEQTNPQFSVVLEVRRSRLADARTCWTP